MSTPPRQVVLSPESLIPVLHDAWAWGQWLHRMVRDAERIGDTDYVGKLSAMRDASLLRSTILADALGIKLPPVDHDAIDKVR